MEPMNFPARTRNVGGKKGKYVVTIINVHVAIPNAELMITSAPWSLYATETVLSIILPYLVFGVALVSLEEATLCLQEVGCDSRPVEGITEV